MSDEYDTPEWSEYEDTPRVRPLRIRAQRQGSFRDPASAGSDCVRAPRGKTLYLQTVKAAARAVLRAKGIGRKRVAIALADAATEGLNQDTGGDNYAD